MAEGEIIQGQHGGYRPGAGRKTGTKVANDGDYALLAQARARREVFRAKLTEIEFKQKAGELYDRGEVLRVIATAIAIFSEQIRSLPDRLERQAGITPEQAEIAEEEVNGQLEALRNKLMNGLADGVPRLALTRALKEMLAGADYEE